MRVKQASSVALFLMFLLLGQSIAANLNQIPSENVDTALDSSAIVMSSNNSSGNNTGGNNSGNNSNPANDSHCITVSNFTITTVYYVTVDLVNICSDAIQYPGVNASASHTGVSGFSNYTNWFYMIAGNDSYNLSWQLSFDQTVTNGTPITLDFEADVLNCGANNSWSHECPNSTLSHQFIFISTNSGNNTGGNNTGGNNTGGNNTGGNNTGGNNTGGNNTGGNNTGGNSPVITVTGTTNNSSNQVSYWNFNYSVSNYYGYIDWNATSEDGTLSSSWTSRIYSNSYQTTSQEYFNQSGNYTVCASISPQGSGSNGTTTSSTAFDCEIIYVYVPPSPVDCGNTSYILIRSNSSVYNAHDVITFSVLVQCGSGENTFTLRGEVARIDGNQNWNYTTLDYYQFSSNLNNSLGNEMYFIFDETSTSGEYMAQFYIGDASNIIGWVQWNFTVYGDDDNDGINEQNDNCAQIYNPNQNDIDGDGVGDSCDVDIDGDGANNQNDSMPTDANETMDTDGDGLGDNADADDDGDGMADSDDAFPLNPTEQADLDGDGVGDNLDADDDGDGITDVSDNCPFVANSDQADLDGDGVGTACDGIELTVDGNGTIVEDGTPIPSIGMVGTAVAISAGFFIAIRREDEE